MPCYDSRDRDDQIRNERHLNALTALFCAYLSRPSSVSIYVNQWKILHDRIDRARRRKDFREVNLAQEDYNRFMARLHDILSKTDEPV